MKLLLVDDEYYVRERILKQIDWNALKIDDVCSVDDGQAALEVACEFKPNILVTDIRMPKMDGIKLAEAFSIHHPECKIIFISGYSDVTYLRSAIRLHVINYVEKPIDMEDLSAAIKSAIDEINSHNLTIVNHSEFHNANLNAQKIAVAKGLKYVTTAAEVSQLFLSLTDVQVGSYYATAITKITNINDHTDLSEGEVQSFISHSVCSNDLSCLGFLQRDCIILQLVCNGIESCRKENLQPTFNKLFSLLQERGLGCFTSIGKFVRDPSQLPYSYQTAIQCAPRCFFKQPGCLCLYRESNGTVMDLDTISISEYSHALKKDNSTTFVYLINNLTVQLRNHEGTSPFDIIRFYYSILLLMYRSAQKANIALSDRFSDEYQMMDCLKHYHYLDEIRDFIIQVAHEYYENVKNNYTKSPIVNQIINYLDHHYTDPDLSVTKVSDYMNLSSAYICHLFKSVMGSTIGSHLTQIRICKALELIESNKYKVKEIANMVGYRNGNYFSYVFRKQKGYPPSAAEDENEDLQ